MKKYYEYKTIQQAANAFARSERRGRATGICLGDSAVPVMGEQLPFGYRKYTTGEYVLDAYRNNFGWKNTYYQSAVSEVLAPVEWYLWFGWRI